MTSSSLGSGLSDRRARLGFVHHFFSGIRSAMRICMLAYGGLFICYLLARLSIGERWNVVALANNLLPWFCWIGMILGGIGLLYSDRWLLVGLQMPAVVVFGFVYGNRFLPARATPAVEGPTLTVATYNVCG